MSENGSHMVQSCEDSDEPPPPPPQRVRAAVFFDGTGNNRENSRRGDTSHLGWIDSMLGGASYQSSPSNVAKGEEAMGVYPDVDNSGQHYYIEGIGTQTGGADLMDGFVLGMGDEGVPAKVRKGLQRLVDDVAMLDPGRPIEYVHIDTFGFSRGAATARLFVDVVLKHSELNVMKQLTDLGFSVDEVKVKFVGLYDTVASYGINHEDDTKDLKLDAIKDAEYTFQLAAGEEHRVKFPLTDIQAAGGGRQIYLPGDHSDIGGGHNDFGEDKDMEVVDLDWRGIFNKSDDEASLQRERQWLIDRGWYGDSEDELSQPNFSWEILANRKGIRNTYAHLPLNMMSDEARDQGLPVRKSVAARHPIPSDPIIQALKDKIDESVAAGNEAKDDSYRDHWLQMIDPDVNAARHKYFHMSSRYGEAMKAHHPRYTAHPSDGGVRQRAVHKG